MTLNRREFVVALGAGAASALLPTGHARAARAQRDQSSAGGVRRTMSGPMNDNAYRPVQRPPRAAPAAGSLMPDAERDALEHRLHCQCGCTLDIYTCRTTDFTCPVSPAMHQDVVRLVAGGYAAPEILTAFRDTYGERVLMAPPREGLNWAAYLTPFAVLGAGAATVAVLIRRWRPSPSGLAPGAPSTPDRGAQTLGIDATPAEMARLAAAVRDDGV